MADTTWASGKRGMGLRGTCEAARSSSPRVPILRFVIVFLLAILSSPGTAMQTTSPAPAAQLGPTDFLGAAQRVVAAVDRYEMGMIWDVSSPIMKASIARDLFISSTAQQRAMLGSITARDWTAIMRVIISQKSGPLPPGRYMSVRFRTTGQNGKSLEEVVSFHLDTDGQWKMAGYSILQETGAKP